MTPDDVLMADLEAKANAYAEAIFTIVDMGDGDTSLGAESLAALFASLTCLWTAMKAKGEPVDEFRVLVDRVVYLVSRTATAEESDLGGKVSALLRDMEGF